MAGQIQNENILLKQKVELFCGKKNEAKRLTFIKTISFPFLCLAENIHRVGTGFTNNSGGPRRFILFWQTQPCLTVPHLRDVAKAMAKVQFNYSEAWTRQRVFANPVLTSQL